MNFLSKFRKNEDGVATVEAAIVFPVLVAIGLGAMDASILLMQNHKLSTSLSSAGNYIAYATDPKSVEEKAKNIAVTGKLDVTADPLIANLDQNKITITYKDIANPEIDGSRDYRGDDVLRLVEISGEIDYQGIGLLKALTGGKITVNGRFETRLVRVKIW